MKKRFWRKPAGRGVDLVIEMLANVNLVRDLELIAKRGRIAIVGNRGALELNPRAIMGKDATVVGFTNWNALPGELAMAHAAIVAGMERSGYKPQVGKEMPLADAPRAHEDVLKSGAYGKIVLDSVRCPMLSELSIAVAALLIGIVGGALAIRALDRESPPRRRVRGGARARPAARRDYRRDEPHVRAGAAAGHTIPHRHDRHGSR